MNFEQLKRWNAEISQAVRMEYSDTAISSVIDFVSYCTGCRKGTLIVFKKQSKPEWPFAEIFDEDEVHKFIQPYVEGAYLLDPYYNLSINGKEGVYTIADAALDGFYHSEFYKLYYQNASIKDEICLLVNLGNGDSAIVAYCRFEGEAKFDEQDRQLFDSLFNMIKLLVSNWWLSGSKEDNTEHKLDLALTSFGSDYLTQREAEITQLCLKGDSIKSQAEKLQIGQETIKQHRKNIYGKLGISSQSELFYLFLDCLKSYDPCYSLDPLLGYFHKQQAC